MNISEYKLKEDSLCLSCNCGWDGKAKEVFNDYYEEVFDFVCPQCEKMLLIVNVNG